MRELMPLCAHLEIDLVRASPEEVVESTEWGRTTIVAETELTDAQGRPVTRPTQTQAVLSPRTG